MLIAITNVIIANIEISIPWKGSTERLALRPRTAARPIPHDAHPGIRTPAIIPIEETIPARL